MPSAPLPPNEAERLEALRGLFVLDSEPEAVFDSIVRMASQACGTPIALLSLVDAERQWFKAEVGLPGVAETPREAAFCAHALASDATLIVPDALADARFADSPLVTGAPDIRFYAGVPLVLEQGIRLGTLCVIDRVARSLDAEQERQLRALAGIARDALAMRHQLIHRSLSVRSQLETSLEQSERRYRSIVERQNELVSLARRDGSLVYVNPAYARHLGRSVESLAGASLYDFVAPADHEDVRRRIERVFDYGESSSSVNRNTRPDGSERWVDWINTLQRDANGEFHLHSVGRDVTAETVARQELVRQTATLQGVAQAIPAMLAVVGSDGRYRLVNAAFERWCGRSSSDIVGRTVEEVIGAQEAQRSRPWFERALAGQTVHFEKSYPERRDGTHFAISLVPLRLASGRIDGFVTVGHDISHHKAEKDRLRDLSQRDALTGLLNRSGFENFIGQQRTLGMLDTLAFLYIDLDRFKQVNDTHGHTVGDELLRVFANRLERLVRPTDAVARLGGDEFVIALVGMQAQEHAQAVADKVALSTSQPYAIGALSLKVGASVGLAFDEDPGSRWQGLLDDADARLYEAKRATRDPGLSRH